MIGWKFKHRKTGDIYTVLYQGRLQTAHPSEKLEVSEVMIVYQADRDQSVWIRAAREFLDGRFELVI